MTSKSPPKIIQKLRWPGGLVAAIANTMVARANAETTRNGRMSSEVVCLEAISALSN